MRLFLCKTPEKRLGLCILQLDYLRHVMIQLSAIPELWQVQCIQKVWRSVLLAGLDFVLSPGEELNDEQLAVCLETADLLRR